MNQNKQQKVWVKLTTCASKKGGYKTLSSLNETSNSSSSISLNEAQNKQGAVVVLT